MNGIIGGGKHDPPCGTDPVSPCHGAHRCAALGVAMNDDDKKIPRIGVLIIGWMIGAISFGWFAEIIGQSASQTYSYQELVDRGLGIYCPTTGDFAFIGECDKEDDE